MKNKIDYKTLAKQLSCPDGDIGIEIGENMNLNNIGMTTMTVDLLNLQNKEQILELGHGNCKHLNYVLKQAENLGYIGLEISETMNREANQNNCSLLNIDRRFELFDGNRINFHEKRFDKIFSVNTLYFWENPEQFLREIYRVLKFKGFFALTFSTKDFMKKLAFTEFGFKLYSEKEVVNMLRESKFIIKNIEKFAENVISKDGQNVNRESIIILVSK